MATKKTQQNLAMRVSITSIIGNVALSALKLIAGIFASSSALVSDAVHSLSDVFSTFVVMVGMKVAGKASDKEHQYGHERFESVAAIVLSIMLLATGIGIGYSGIQKIIGREAQDLAVPGVLALVAAITSIAVKEAMYWYTRRAAKILNSGALMADAWHHRSDALSSVGSFIGVLGARMGYPVLDPVASLVICIFIVKAAVDIFMDAINKMTDKACDEETSNKIRDIILEQEGVLRIDELRTRMFGDKIYVDIEIAVEGTQSLNEAHRVAQTVHDAVEGNFDNVKHCMVHVNPYVATPATEVG